MEFHEVAEYFPLMQGQEFNDLCQDIARNGLLESIWLHPDGRIVDGRNRYRACQQIGIDPKFRTWSGEGSLVGFVLSLNLHRRHLTSGQRAVLALEVEPFFAGGNKVRLIKGAEITRNENIGCGNISTTYDTKPDKAKARDQAAKATGTNGRYVSDVKRIQQDAPAVFEQIKTGELNIPQAKQKVARTKIPDPSHQSKPYHMVNDWLVVVTSEGLFGIKISKSVIERKSSLNGP